jgi:hypothetical protein
MLSGLKKKAAACRGAEGGGRPMVLFNPKLETEN